MSQELRLELRQSQQLVMTPLLQQAIKLLQMSNLELREFVEREVEANPLIEIRSAEKDDPPLASDPASAPRGEPESAPAEDPSRIGEVFDTGHENLFEREIAGPGADPREMAGTSMRVGSGGNPTFDDGPGWEDRLADRPGLADHLAAQIGQMRAPKIVRRLALHLVGQLDEHGYLRTNLGESAAGLGVAEDVAVDALRLLQRCEPTGVGARSLAECLALQLAERDRLDPAMRALLDHLHLIQRGEHRLLRRLCGVDADDYEDMLTELRGLNPRPCGRFDGSRTETLVPDILVRRDATGGWQVELNPETLPRILMDRRYAARITASESNGAAKAWLGERRQRATWLIRSLDQRARTIVTVAGEILRRQERFFEEGIAGLRPLTLRMVAEEAGIHESTVSRVTSGKYMATPRGTFELKFFFTNALGGTEGGEAGVASQLVRHRIRALVDAESPRDILSDDAIVALLREEGVDIARRTVAKYRKTLKIPSSVGRRRLKAIRA